MAAHSIQAKIRIENWISRSLSFGGKKGAPVSQARKRRIELKVWRGVMGLGDSFEKPRGLSEAA